MKCQISSIIIIALFFMLTQGLACSNDPYNINTSDTIHIRKGFVNPIREYKFENVPDNIKFVSSFPWEVIRQEVSAEHLNIVNIEYWIYTSIDDAELSMVERLDMSALGMRNIIDFPLSEGRIGDNCWYILEFVGTITFIRNNVLLLIWFNGNGTYDSKIIESVARKVDAALVKVDKVSKDNIPAPVINSVEIISALPETWEQPVELRIDAQDPNNQKLHCRKYASGFGNISETGVLTVYPFKPVDESEEPKKAKIKIWVWNEDHIVSSVEKEIPFRRGN
jgi:hypothetical protein